MNAKVKSFLRTALLVSVFALLISAMAQAQPMPADPPSRGAGGNQGSAAPIGDGAWILVALVIGYGVHTFTHKKKDNHEEE